MNDQQQPYGPYDRYDGYGQPRIVGYDEYGQPVYQQPPESGGQDSYGTGGQAYGQQQPGGAGGYDPYGGQAYGGEPGRGPEQMPQYDPYAQQPGPYGAPGQAGTDTGTQPAVDTTGQWAVPLQQQAQHPQGTAQGHPAQQPLPPQQAPATQQSAYVPPQRPGTAAGQGGHAGPLPDAAPGPERDYRTEQFSFVEEPDENSEDVIDWLKFTESRSERREEAKRRGKRRIVALVVVLALAVVGGAGYLWYAGRLPGLGSTAAAKHTVPVGAQKRDVIVVHLHDISSKLTSTALLVNNETTGQGTTVLLPNALALPNDDGTTTTLGSSVADDGSDGTRDAIGTLLGAKVSGTWRLDTPYLENLVELVGNIDVDTNVSVPDTKKGAEPVVQKGSDQTLSGQMAVAYATYRAPGEAQDAQLARFGQVMQAVLRKMSSNPKDATVTVQTLAQILDPSLTDQDLGTALAHLAEHAKNDDYRTVALPVQKDGTVSAQATDDVVKKVLGGSLSAPSAGGPVTVSVKDGSGKPSATESARISVVNAGFSYVSGGSGSTVATSSVSYTQDKDKDQAIEIGKTLGLPSGAVRKGSGADNADITVVLGADYKPQDFKTGQ